MLASPPGLSSPKRGLVLTFRACLNMPCLKYPKFLADSNTYHTLYIYIYKLCILFHVTEQDWDEATHVKAEY